ncbi:uncharacterized protein MKK02DRAFT_28418 [Dioszegia hungarica]|uniref:DUF427 domain-containing protein n=1 Tax=Dioszegia hungarica TaxID=4972 RepID=A0AA38H430_9TREE|nr:uncharacterized protein MKK02DRAFT_28418 [Dioszegia hungarica]KAI9633610.1 hypothetical protein MKK02DRAFT_28418 [Dioszegia hungarica]
MSADNMTAILMGDKVLAQAMTSDLEKVEGNWYFKESALIDRGRYSESGTHTTCGWKGEASYFNYKGEDGKEIKDIAWFYPTPKKGAEHLSGRVAFYVGKAGLKVGVPPV